MRYKGAEVAALESKKLAKRYRRLPKLNQRSLLGLSLLVAVPIVWLQFKPHSQQIQKHNFVANLVSLQLPQPSPLVTLDKPQPITPVQPQQKKAKEHSTKSVKHKRPTNKTTKHSPKRKQKPHKYTAPAIELRVAIARNVSQLAIASSTSAKVIDANRRVIMQLLPGQAFQAQTANSTIFFQDWQVPSFMWIEPTRGGAVYVGGFWYRGKVLLLSQGDTLLAVNYVDLEQYLTSVVGSEMSGAAPIEALKAQAIAARSYALVHKFRPATQWYDLGNDERHQAYKGVATEYNTTHQAVNETAGQILSYQGGVVESLYGATQEIVTNAHNGWGMSQTGAYTYASSGYNYQQILAIYYPKTELSRLEAKR